MKSVIGDNIQPVIRTEKSINLGSVYESVVAQELKAHGHNLFYYDNRQRGEVDFLVDDKNAMSVLPIEVKSGRDYTIHSALTRMVEEPEYNIKSAIVFSNEREINTVGKITYMPIYYVMFIDNTLAPKQLIF